MKTAFYRPSNLNLCSLFINQNRIIYRFFSPSLSLPPTSLLEQILTANINTYSEVENALQPIIMAQKVRIYPYSQYDRTVCLRAELIGCIWDGEFCCVIRFFPPLPRVFVWGLQNKTFLASKSEKTGWKNFPLLFLPMICARFFIFCVP
jgi:hypothetical protein